MGFAPPNASALRTIANTLIRDEPAFPEVKAATDSFFELLISITGIQPDDSRWLHPVLLPSGKGIGPYWAALCIQDILRTKRFVRGLYLAIESARNIFQEQPIHILYAGTGPFATLALPLTALYKPDQVQFTFIEIHPEAFQSLSKTISYFGIQPFIHKTVLADAVHYRPDLPAHILLTETMQRGLEKEPQVAITQHLLPFLHPDGILVPESVCLYAGLLDPSKEMDRLQDFDHPSESYIRPLHTILDLNKWSAPGTINGFPMVEISVEPDRVNGYSQLSLFTRVTVYGSEILRPWESGLTLPKMLMRFEEPLSAAARLTFQYLNGPKPGVQFRRIE